MSGFDVFFCQDPGVCCFLDKRALERELRAWIN